VNTPLNICVISGSTRDPSASGAIARAAARDYVAAGARASVVDLRDMPPEALAHKAVYEPPATFTAFASPAVQADALVVVVPEYNGGPSAAIKAFIDLIPALRHCPVALVGVAAGAWGGLRPVEHLSAVFAYRMAFLYPGHVFVRDCEDAIDAAGELTDADVRVRLSRQSAAFTRFATAVRHLRSIDA
jgi:chromate reductase